MKKIYKLIPLLSGILFVQFYGVENLKSSEPSVKDSVSFAVVGDLMCHSSLYKFAQNDTSFNFDPYYQYIKEELSSVDFTIGNLETTIADSNFSGYPQFKTPAEYVKGLKNNGFDILFTSNNHSYDNSKFGVLNTIKHLKKNNLIYFGTNESESERDSIKIFEKNGITFTFLSYTDNLNGFSLKKNEKFLVNLINPERINKDIAKAREKNADIIVIYLHFGNEYERRASKQQRELVNKIINSGADLILASHPHVIQEIEFFKPKNEKIKESFMAYSLGNFISNQQWRYSDNGMILFFDVKKMSDDTFRISNVEILPTWVYKVENKGFFILPADSNGYKNENLKLDEKINNKIIQSYNDTRELIFKDSLVYERIKFIKTRKAVKS